MTDSSHDIASDQDELEQENAQKDKYLTFHINDEEFGIGIDQVTEIVGIQKITAVPNLPDFVKGVINMRGKIIPVMDVRLRFQLPFMAYGARSCIILVERDHTTVGLAVDKVNEVVDIPAQRVESAHALVKDKANPYIMGLGQVENQVKILLNIDKLLFDHPMAAM